MVISNCSLFILSAVKKIFTLEIDFHLSRWIQSCQHRARHRRLFGSPQPPHPRCESEHLKPVSSCVICPPAVSVLTGTCILQRIATCPTEWMFTFRIKNMSSYLSPLILLPPLALPHLSRPSSRSFWSGIASISLRTLSSELSASLSCCS